ncbi:hypothetical protein DFQ27_005116 [Actinomortierella ambigua]|uniref:F-box domain-containing protein n=1 Tax=Actinomortierella ambigua TaxID=1343610 RepID=A0A9P6QKP9_9FUNG|nr:hypothetical protein DFQ27_005116 [Actinomortierella ambigua]
MAYLDLSSKRALILTCRHLFRVGVPILYKNPFQLIADQPERLLSSSGIDPSRPKFRNNCLQHDHYSRTTRTMQQKLVQTARLVQLFLACIRSIQSRLPALCYPGYGRQWVRPPCTTDYLKYFVDHSSGSLLIRSFSHLFADLIKEPWKSAEINLNASTLPIIQVQNRIHQAFIEHNPENIQILAISVTNFRSISSQAHALSTLTTLELTDVTRDFDLESVIDFIRSHRMVFGRALVHLRFRASYGRLRPAACDLMKILETMREPETVDLSGWRDALFYISKIPTDELRTLLFSLTDLAPGLDVATIWKFMERCQHLGHLRMPVMDARQFEWAAAHKRKMLISRPILATKRSTLLSSMKRIELEGPVNLMIPCIKDALFAYQSSLKKMWARTSAPSVSTWAASVVLFECRLPFLTELHLEGPICFQFELPSLTQLPALRTLRLRAEPSEYASAIVPIGPLVMTSLARSSSSIQSTVSSMAKSSSSILEGRSSPSLSLSELGQRVQRQSNDLRFIAFLPRLAELTLHGPWTMADTYLRLIADHCRRLSHVELVHTVGTTIGGLLLAIENMRRLEFLRLHLHAVSDLYLVYVAKKKLVFSPDFDVTACAHV